MDGVICDLFFFNRELGGLYFFIFCDIDRVDESFVFYSYIIVKVLKKVFVI